MRSFRAPFELILVVRDQLVDRPGSILFFVHNKKNLALKKSLFACPKEVELRYNHEPFLGTRCHI